MYACHRWVNVLFVVAVFRPSFPSRNFKGKQTRWRHGSPKLGWNVATTQCAPVERGSASCAPRQAKLSGWLRAVAAPSMKLVWQIKRVSFDESASSSPSFFPLLFCSSGWTYGSPTFRLRSFSSQKKTSVTLTRFEWNWIPILIILLQKEKR